MIRRKYSKEMFSSEEKFSLDHWHLKLFSSGSGTISNVLNKATLRAISNSECRLSFGETIVDSILCARNDQDGAGTCHGDSGGTLQYRNEGDGAWVQVGGNVGTSAAPEFTFKKLRFFLPRNCLGKCFQN